MKQLPIPNKPAPTAAQQAIWHVAQSAGLSSLITLLIGITQYLSSGNINPTTLLTVLGGGFLTALTMVWKSVSSNPSLAQAALDTAQLALQRIEQVAPWLASDLAKIAHQPPALSIPNQTTAIIPAMPVSTAGGVYPQPVPVRTSTPPYPGTASYPGQYQQQPMDTYNLNASATGTVPPALSFLQQVPQQGQQVRGG